jgi:hypothetical protein
MTTPTSAMDYRDLRVFISSRMGELADERRAIKAAFTDAGINAWVFEAPDGAGAQPRPIQRAYLDELDQSDLYLGIFWRGYGEYTEDEYRHAAGSKPCLVYEKHVDIAGTRDPKLQALLNEMSAVKDGLTIQRFTTADELTQFATRDVRRLLTAIFRDRAALAATPMQAPAPRAEFVPRPAVSSAIKAALLAPRADGDPTLRAVVVQGMGGSGKSMLAAAVARDREVRAAFRDGVLWTMLGQTPNVGAVLEGWIRALGNDAFRFSTEAVARSELSTLLSERRVLVVIDDASDPAHVEPLLVGSATSAVLITTREQIVAQAAGATGDRVIEVRGVTPDEALVILAGGPGRTLAAADVALARQVAEAVGYLPLALSLAAIQAADGVTWAELVADLTAEINRLEALEVAGAGAVAAPDVQKRLSLRASLNVSLAGLTAQQRERFEALGVLRKGAVISPAVAATVWNVDERTARNDLRYLRGKALLLVAAPAERGATVTYTMHDVVRDLAWELFVERNGGKPASAHAAYLERIRARLTDDQWHTAPDDGYVRDNLIFHFERADRADLVHRLLTERSTDGTNAWWGTRSGQVDRYLDDVRRGFQLALDGKGGDTTPIGLPEQLFYLAILTTYASFSPPPTLARELVLKDRLGLSAARAYALATHDAARRVKALALLAETTAGTARDALLDDALAAARSLPGDDSETSGWLSVRLAEAGRSREALALAVDIDGNQERAVALGGIIPYVAPEDRATALERAVDSAMATGTLFVPGAVEGIVGHLDEPALRRVIAEVQAMTSPTWRDDTLALLVPRLADLGHVDEAVALARSLTTPPSAVALATILPKLSEPQHRDALRAALDAIRDVDDEARRQALKRDLEDAMDATMLAFLEFVIAGHSWRADTFAQLAPSLPPDMLAEALAMATSATDPVFRVTGVAALLPLLDPAARRDAEMAAREHVQEIEEAEDRVLALVALLQNAVPANVDDLATRLLDAVEAIDFSYQRSQRLASAAAVIPPNALSRALDIVDRLPADERLTPVEAIAPRLDPAGLDRAFSLTRAIQDGDAVREARIAALTRLGDEDRVEAIAIARGIENAYTQAAAIATLVPLLPEPAVAGALDAVRRLRDRKGEPVIDVVLPAFARRASGQARDAAIRELVAGIVAMSDGERAAWKVDEIHDLLSARDYEDLLAAAPAIAERSSEELQLFERVVLEVELLRGLPEPARSTTFDGVLADLPKLDEAYEQRNMLVAAARNAPDLAFPRVVDAAVDIADPIMRAMTLVLLMGVADDETKSSIVRRIGEIAELRGPLGADERGLVDLAVARMLEHVPFDEPIDMIAGFENENARSIGVASVARRLGKADGVRALAIARAIDDRSGRVEALLALTDVVPEEPLVEEALASAITTDPETAGGELLASVVGRVVDLPAARLSAAWVATATRLANCPRPALVAQLAGLVPVVERGGGDRMLRALATSLGDVARWFP